LVKREWKWLARIPRIVIRVPGQASEYCIVVQEFFQARVEAWFETVKAYSTLNIIDSL
jgi:hypothetical protein